MIYSYRGCGVGGRGRVFGNEISTTFFGCWEYKREKRVRQNFTTGLTQILLAVVN